MAIWPVSGNSVATYIPPEQLLNFENFNSLPPALRGMQTHIVFVDTKGNMFNLAGPSRGRQGVRINKSMVGEQNWPFDLVLTESPYIMGADIERVNINKREFNFGIIIGNHAPPMTEYQYRMAESHWWDSQDETADGWLGIYTRFSGWRWIPVRPNTTVMTPQPMDSTAFGNNCSQWDLTWLASRPYFTKPARYLTWKAAGTPIIDGLHTGHISLANGGDLPSYVYYLVSSPGTATVQDNNSDRMVTLPTTIGSDGTFMCDTEPGKRTLTAANDPIDNEFYKILRQSKILDTLLHQAGELGLPLQLRFDKRFLYNIPPRTELVLKVQHTNPDAVITAYVPQRFKRSR